MFSIRDDDDDSCDIMGPVSFIIQFLLGLLALSSLIYKRSKEYPIRRPWKIWFFDVSKQVFGSFGIHILNLLMSIISGGDFEILSDDELNDPCNYYFLNILFDTTIGVPILYLCLLSLYQVTSFLQLEGVNSGEYGQPPKFTNYLKQLVIYMIGLVMMKFIIYIVLIFCPILLQLADFILSVFNKNDDLQLVFVLMVFPLVMNSLQYYLIDNIIQSPEYKNHSPRNTDDDKGLLGQPQPTQHEGEFSANSTDYGSI